MKNLSKHWVVLILCCLLVSASLGIMANASGVFYSPVSEDLGIARGSFAFQQTIFLIVVSLGAYFVPTFVKRFPYRIILAISVGINAAATVLMGMMSNLIAFYVLSIIRGISASFFFMVPISMIVTNWFVEKRGLAMSIAMCFNGVLGAIASPVLTAIINALGWRMAYTIMAIMIVVLCIPAIIYPWSFSPEQEGLKAYGYVEEDIDFNVSKPIQKKEPLVPVVLITMIIFALFTFGVTSLAQHFPGYASSIGFEIGATMLSLTMIGNIISTVACGSLSDKIGVVKSTYLFLFIGLIGISMIAFIHTPLFLLVGAFLFGAIFCMGSVVLPLLTEKFFGIVNYNTIYPTLALAGNIGAAAFLTIIGFIYDGLHSYTLATLSSVIMVFSCIIIVGYNMFYRNTHRRKS